MVLFVVLFVVVFFQRMAVCCLLFAAWLSGPAGAQDVIVYTEEYPPFNIALEGGEVGGLATANVRQVLDAAGLSYEIRLVPWARAILYAETQPNVFIYSLTRVPSREADFDWLVRLADTDFKVYARADETRPVTLDAIRAGTFTGVCVSRDLSCELFELLGIPDDRLIVVTDNYTGDFRMVIAGRADLYISQLSTNPQWRLREGFDPASTKATIDVSGATGLYLAAGPQVPKTLRDQVRASYEKLMQAGVYKLVDGAKAQR